MRLLFLLLIMAPNMMLAQQAQQQSSIKLSQFEIDSLEILAECQCEISIAKYRDVDGNTYKVYLDKQRREVFIIKRVLVLGDTRAVRYQLDKYL